MAELTSTPSEQFSDNHETAPPRKGLKHAIKNAMPANIIFFTDGTKPGEEAVTSHRFGDIFPSIWSHFIALKRLMPRWFYFPSLFVATLAVSAIWVLPTTFSYLQGTNSVQRDNYCYSWAAKMPPSSFYNDNLTPGNPNGLPAGDQINSKTNSLNVPAMTTVLPQLDQDGNNRTVLGCSQPRPGETVAGHWAAVDLQLANQAALDYGLFGGDVPSFSFLAASLDVAPTGSFNPADGKVALTAEFKPREDYPSFVATSASSFVINNTFLYYKITFFVNCNGNLKSCDSTQPCIIITDCSSEIQPINAWSSALYPFDKYAFGININAWAKVECLNKGGPDPYQVAIPLFVSFSQINPAFKFSLVTDSAVLKEFKYSSTVNGNTAIYSYPPVFTHGLPNLLGIRYLYQVTRAPILQAWAMFLVVMMWINSTVLFITSWDYVFLRPRDIPAAMHGAAIAMIFALPSIRSSMPGVPPIGIVTDVGGFFWNELMCIATAVFLVAGSFGQYRYGNEMRTKYNKALSASKPGGAKD